MSRAGADSDDEGDDERALEQQLLHKSRTPQAQGTFKRAGGGKWADAEFDAENTQRQVRQKLDGQSSPSASRNSRSPSSSGRASPVSRSQSLNDKSPESLATPFTRPASSHHQRNYRPPKMPAAGSTKYLNTPRSTSSSGSERHYSYEPSVSSRGPYSPSSERKLSRPHSSHGRVQGGDSSNSSDGNGGSSNPGPTVQRLAMSDPDKDELERKRRGFERERELERSRTRVFATPAKPRINAAPSSRHRGQKREELPADSLDPDSESTEISAAVPSQLQSLPEHTSMLPPPPQTAGSARSRPLGLHSLKKATSMVHIQADDSSNNYTAIPAQVMRVRGDIDFLRNAVPIDGIPLSNYGPLVPSENYPTMPGFTQPSTSRPGSANAANGLSARQHLTMGALIDDPGMSRQGVGPTGTPSAPNRTAALAIRGGSASPRFGEANTELDLDMDVNDMQRRFSPSLTLKGRSLNTSPPDPRKLEMMARQTQQRAGAGAGGGPLSPNGNGMDERPDKRGFSNNNNNGGGGPPLALLPRPGPLQQQQQQQQTPRMFENAPRVDSRRLALLNSAQAALNFQSLQMQTNAASEPMQEPMLAGPSLGGGLVIPQLQIPLPGSDGMQGGLSLGGEMKSPVPPLNLAGILPGPTPGQDVDDPNLLLVEDVKVSQRIATMALHKGSSKLKLASGEEVKFRVRIAESGDEAVKLFQQYPGLKVVLMDINLPGSMGGVDAVKQIRLLERQRRFASRATIFALTSNTTPQNVRDYAAAEFDGCIAKGKLIAENVIRALERRRRQPGLFCDMTDRDKM